MVDLKLPVSVIHYIYIYKTPIKFKAFQLERKQLFWYMIDNAVI